MDATRFDHLTRTCGALITRRRGLGMLAALGFGIPADQAEARKRKKQKKRKKGAAAKCMVRPDGPAATSTITVRHKKLTLTATDQLPSNPGDPQRSTTTVRRGDTLLLKIEASIGAFDAGLDITYGAGFSGIEQANLVIEQGPSGPFIYGTIDGREFESFVGDPPQTLEFADGLPAPEMTVNKAVASQLKEIFAKARAQRIRCAATDGPARRADVGKEDAAERECAICKGACLLASSQCGWAAASGCSPSLAIPFAGPGIYGFCLASALAACIAASVSCLGTCRESRACCPEQCGTLPDWSCCFGGEKCLTWGTGFGECCAVGYTPCHEKNCCAPLETCRDDGVCCPAGTRPCAGKTCCNATDVCMPNGTCCPADREICGGVCCSTACCRNVCCPAGQSCSPTTGECAVVCNPNLDQRPCPNQPGYPACCTGNTTCCQSGDCCLGGWKCCPGSEEGCCAPGQECCLIAGRNFCVDGSCVR